jgi:phospholipase/lecithinase/hemolysin
MSLIDAASLGLAGSPSFLGAATPSYGALYAFGDSLSDAGNIYTASLHLVPTSPYYHGHFSNGITWVENLALDLGLPALKPSLQGGNDFAYGDAETGQETLHTISAIDLPTQLAQFLVADPTPAPNALYTVSIGANDVLDATGAYATNPSAANTDIAQAVANETAFVSALIADGATNVLVMNVPDLGKTPAERSQGTTVAHTASKLASMYDAQLNAALGTVAAVTGADIHILNSFSLIDQAVAHPSDFGLTNVTKPVWTGNYVNPLSGHLNATGAAQNGYLFFDQLHPTETGHLALASAALQDLSGPALA